jgi:SnoaL-like protein
MTDVATVVDDYIAIWNEASDERRREIIARTWADEATYVDPVLQGEGPEGINAMVAGAQQQFPGHRFELTAGPDVHHDRVRFAWRMLDPKGATTIAGVDFARLAADGRLREVTGFLES